MGAPVLLALDSVVFKAARLKLGTESDPFVKSEQADESRRIIAAEVTDTPKASERKDEIASITDR
jgi:hypothetical protein